MPRARLIAASLLGATSLAPCAQAGDAAYDPTPIARNDEWIVTVKGTAGVEPSFPGSDRFSAFGYPSFTYRRAVDMVRFTAPDDGAGLAVYDTSWLRIGPVARFESGRYLDDDRRLSGLRDVEWSVEPGLFVDVWATNNLRARMEIRHGLHGHQGLVGNIGVDWVLPYDRLTVSAGPRVALGDGDFTRSYFGVKPIEASLNGVVSPFSPRGGVTSVGALASASYTWSESWSTTVFGGYGRLVDDAAESPIVRAFGSRDQFSVGLSAAYSFRTRGLW